MLQRVASPVVAVLLALFVATSFVGSDSSRPEPPPDYVSWIDTSNRAEVLAAHQAVFTRPVPAMNWTGSADGCRPGDSSDALRRETLVRISYYRAMAGVPADVVEDPLMSDKAQAAALMMSAEGELTHHPDPDYACFSDAGQEAAANSNLYLGRTGPAAIDGYIEDPGDKNVDVGHRSTILHPPTDTMGIGHVAGTTDRYPSNALWVFDDGVFESDYEVRESGGFVAWPPRGHVPIEVIYPRWSFALQRADFDEATVSVTDINGENVPLKVVARISKDGEIPSSVIVWEPELDLDLLEDGLTFTVTVNGVIAPQNRARSGIVDIGDGERTGVAASRSTYSYQVILVDGSPTSGSLGDILRPVSDATADVIQIIPFRR